MAKEKTVNDILTKLVNIFKKDMYILDYKYCLGGEETEESTPGTAIAVLETDEQEIFRKEYDGYDIILFKNIRNFKKEKSEEWLKREFDEEERKRIFKKRDQYISLVLNIEYWEDFKLKDKEKENLFTKKGIIGIKVNDKLTLILSTSLFPLVTLKNIDKTFYTILVDDKNRGGVFLVIKHIHAMFNYYNFIYYLSI